MELNEQDIARFWAKVDKNGPIQPHMDTPCWLWTAGCFDDAYGAFKLDGKTQKAHIISAKLEGIWVAELLILHSCDIRNCVNPSHLRAGTYQDNANDRDSRGRGLAGRTVSVEERDTRGSLNGRALVSESDVRAIRAEREARVPYKVTCERFGIKKSQYYNIVNGNQWTHVGE